MKKRITNKALREKGYKMIIRVGYCALQTLLRHEEASYYNHGRYGWNYDVYEFDNCAIITGYRNHVGEKAKGKVVEEYEKKAMDFFSEKNCRLSYDDTKKSAQKDDLRLFKKSLIILQ